MRESYRLLIAFCCAALLPWAHAQDNGASPDPPTPSGATTSSLQVGSAEARFGMHFNPVNFTPPKVERTLLPNGIPCFYYAEPGLPLVTVIVRIGVGSINDPPEKIGAAELTAQVMRNGGTARLPGDQLDVELESRGADFAVGTDREETNFRITVLKEDLAWGLGVLSDVLTNPALPAAKLDEARGPRLVEIQQKLDVPMELSRDLFPQLIQGKGNPWGWTATEETLKALTVADLRGVYEKFYKTGNMLIGISGGVTREEADAALAGTLGKLAKAEFTAPQVAPPQDIESARVYIVPREATQNVIYFGHGGITRHDPRKFPVRVFNNVLAGGFTSRLFQEVRSNRGLAYSVGGRIGEGTVRGLFYNVAMTKAPSTAEALDLMLKLNRELTQALPRPDEMEVAVQSDVNAFVFFFDRGDKIVQQQMTLEAYKYPADYLQTYVKNLEAVTPERVENAAKELLHLDRVVVMVVGKIDPALRAHLEKLGPVTEITDAQLRAEWL